MNNNLVIFFALHETKHYYNTKCIRWDEHQIQMYRAVCEECIVRIHYMLRELKSNIININRQCIIGVCVCVCVPWLFVCILCTQGTTTMKQVNVKIQPKNASALVFPHLTATYMKSLIERIYISYTARSSSNHLTGWLAGWLSVCVCVRNVPFSWFFFSFITVGA